MPSARDVCEVLLALLADSDCASVCVFKGLGSSGAVALARLSHAGMRRIVCVRDDEPFGSGLIITHAKKISRLPRGAAEANGLQRSTHRA